MNIKPTQLVIKNIGKLEGEQTIEINKPLILFYGEIRQGKSTILNCVRWVCGGEFPDDIITHGAKEGSIELRFDGGMIGRSFYKSKEGATKARPVVFVRNGKPVPSPVTEIKRFLNPFLLDQDFLRNKTELERKQYFTELFAVDTTELDTELFNSQREAQQLRAKIGGYGEIDLTPVEAVDVGAVKAELQKIKTTHNQACVDASARNRQVGEYNLGVARKQEDARRSRKTIEELERGLANARVELAATEEWLKSNAEKSEEPLPNHPDTAALETKIQDGGAQNVRAENYKAAKKRSEEKAEDAVNLSLMEKRQRDIKAEKQGKLKTISDSCGIAGLSFDDSGNFVYQDTTAGMISDSQIMRLSSELSALYPDGFGIELLDRGESLGRSIFEYTALAEKNKTSILATIVGEKPSKVPDGIGVFVIKDGVVIP